uniref:ubiquitinyl hydrolase 1 n=1 Tax=Aceria tosichella TaxID=561515 RepID=A0A6G1SM86_9ACAR
MRKYNYEFLSEGWLELESDPSTFTLLIEDLGCLGAQVDEIYDLEQKFDGPVYGFIFLFKWLNNHHQSDRGSRNQNKLSCNSSSSSSSTTTATTATATEATTTTTTSTTTSSSTTTTLLPLEQTVQNDIKHATRGITNSGRGRRNNSNKNNNGNNNDCNQKQSKHQHDDQSMAQSDPWSYVSDDNIINEIFFAKQMISNSCATHALISVLLNCDRDELDLGPTLTHLRDYTKIMAPENKGYAIGNMPLIAKAHNSHASYSSLYCRDRPNQQRGLSFAIRGNQRTNLQQLQNQPETYHFVSYVPIKNRLYELDGLKNYPIDHGPIDPNEDWTEKFRRVIRQRLLENKSDGCDAMNDIRYNLMAVVPDRRVQLKKQIVKLKCHLNSVWDSLRQIEKSANKNDINHKTTSTGSHTDGPPFSPLSNGTLTASETGSICAESPKRSHESEPGDVDIPNPPYSPISNDTLSASESGSTCNSPSRFEDSFFFEEKNPIDRHYFIKFDKIKESTDTGTEKSVKEPLTNISEQEKEEQRFLAIADMKRLLRQLERDIEKNESLLKEENDKRRKYKLDNSRRTHNYEPFIMTFLSMLAKQGNLAQLIEKDLGITTEDIGSPLSTSTATPTRQQQSQSSKTFKQPAPHPPLQPKATNNHNGKTKQEPKKKEQQRGGLTSVSGRPIRATKSKYISTGRPRGRPRKSPD